MVRFLFLMLGVFQVFAGCHAEALTPEAQSAGYAGKNGACIVYLLRHAEKQKSNGSNPSLTAEGKQRAGRLVNLLRDIHVDQVYSTDYLRTRETVAPLAASKELNITLYDPRDLPATAKALCVRQDTSVVVGHSNTTPQLVALLGGDPGPAIDEATEFDRLYLLVIRPGQVVTQLYRYGN